ncbi:ABC transporter permease [Kaarinaea lacus]
MATLTPNTKRREMRRTSLVSISKMALRMLRRDWRAGELRVLAIAIVVAVTCVTAVVFFTDRIGQALKYQAGELIASDLRIVADHELDAAIRNKAKELGLQIADSWNFRSMVLAGDGSRLAEIKAVSDLYPLRGELRIAQQLFTDGEAMNNNPQPGTVWAEPMLLRQLGVDVGDAVYVGSKSFTIAGVIKYEPDRSGDMFSIAPRVMLNLSDLPGTELIQEGSRIRYALLVAGDKPAVDEFRRLVKKRLGRGERVEGVEDARQEVRFALQRAQQFLGLAAIVSVMLSFVAVAMSARRFAERHLNTCAIMRCVGARQSQITQVFFIQLLILSVFASILGCAIGFVAQSVLVNLLGELLVVKLPASSFWPVATGLVVGMVGLTGFALPPVMRLKEVPTLRVLRRDLGRIPPLSLSSYAFGLLAIAGLLLWQAGELKLGSIMLGGMLATAVVLSVVSYGLIRLLKLLPANEGIAWRFGLNNITRRTYGSVIQVLAFGVGITVMLLLVVVRTDILQAWQHNLPEDAANRFIINIQPDQTQPVLDFFAQHNLTNVALYPMVRGRLVAINDKTIEAHSFEDDRARRLVQREFNLSWAAEMQKDNKIIKGKWWSEQGHGQNQFSMEEGIAHTLGVKMGDRLKYSISGVEFSAEVTSIRTVQWDSFQPNFFVVAPPGVLDNFPASYITSFYLPGQSTGVLDELVKRFPNVTVIDISAIMNQVRRIMERVALAVEYVHIFTLLAGLMVLYAAIQATQDERLRENAILRAIGAKRKRLLQGLVTEFTILGALSGLLGAIFAVALGYVVSVHVLELEYLHNLWIWIVGPVGGAIGVGLSGTLGTRKVLSRPPLTVIREL